MSADIEHLVQEALAEKHTPKNIPYTFKIRNSENVLFYFGCHHTADIENPQFGQLDLLWKEFLNEVRAKNGKATVLSEGGKTPDAESIMEATSKYGESGYINFLADSESVQVSRPEPNTGELMNMLSDDFSKEDIALFYFYQIAYTWNNNKPPGKFEGYASHFLDIYKKMSGWDGEYLEYDHLNSRHMAKHQEDFDLGEEKMIRDYVNPYLDNSITNQISFRANCFRDTQVIKEIQVRWYDKYNIFILYGSGHALVHQQVLEKVLLEKK